MPGALKGKMPRCLPDHRAAEAKRLREVYLDLIEKYHVADGTGRRLALLTAQSWRSYQRLTADIHRLESRKSGHGTVQALRRLRRQQKVEAKSFRFGIADLRYAAQASNGHDQDPEQRLREAFSSLSEHVEEEAS